MKKNERRFDKTAEALEQLLLRSTDPQAQRRAVDGARAAFVAQVERARERRRGGELFAPERASFLDLTVEWAGYHDGSEAPPAYLARAIDARLAGRIGLDLQAAVMLLLAGRRYRELARAGQSDRFRDPWTPGPADLEALTAELDGVAPRPQ
jgi:hypothetical protein